jgi:hypothetical protein
MKFTQIFLNPVIFLPRLLFLLGPDIFKCVGHEVSANDDVETCTLLWDAAELAHCCGMRENTRTLLWDAAHASPTFNPLVAMRSTLLFYSV